MYLPVQRGSTLHWIFKDVVLGSRADFFDRLKNGPLEERSIRTRCNPVEEARYHLQTGRRACANVHNVAQGLTGHVGHSQEDEGHREPGHDVGDVRFAPYYGNPMDLLAELLRIVANEPDNDILTALLLVE